MPDDILDWSAYETGAEGWASDTDATDGKRGLRQALDDTRAHITVHDAEAAIQQYAPVAGRVFDATNTEREYVGDGTAWTQRATRGPNPTWQSATVEGATTTEELLLTQYPAASDAPAGSGPGIVGITSDGHILVEDGQ